MTTALARKTLTSLLLKNPSFVSQESNFSSFRYRFSTSSKNEQTVSSDFLIKRHHFSPEAAKCVSAILPYLKNPQETDSILSFLKELGFSNTQLERIVRCFPRIVSVPLVNVESKVKVLHDFGFSASETLEIILTDPFILKYSLSKISSSLSVLMNVLGSKEKLAKILRSPRGLFHSDYEKTLLPNIRYLKSIGIATDQINALLCMTPNFFMIKPESMSNLVEKAAKLGIDRNSRMFIYAVRALGSMNDEACELKFKYFRDLGFTEDDVMRLLRNAPIVLSVSQNKIERVKELLLETGKYDMSCIIRWPSILMSSVEKRYKPRVKVLKDLEKSGVIDKWPSLITLSKLTDDVFFRRFGSQCK